MLVQMEKRAGANGNLSNCKLDDNYGVGRQLDLGQLAWCVGKNKLVQIGI